MLVKAGVRLAVTSLTLTSAARIRANYEIEEQQQTGPDVSAGFRETEVRHCALFHFQSFGRLLEDCDGAMSSEDAMAEAIQHYEVEDSVTISQNDALSLSTMNTDETRVDMELCAEGQPAQPCVQSLPAILWLRQFWRFEDLAHHATLPAADQAKARIINRALSNLGISVSRLHSRCEHDVENPAFEIVRECVVDSLPAWTQNNTVGEVSSPSGEMVDLSDQTTLKATLEEWLRTMWEREDMIAGLQHSAGYFMRGKCSAARNRIEARRHSYEMAVRSTGFPLVRGTTEECLRETPSTLIASGTLERIIQEMSVCSLNNGTCDAENSNSPCPEGFSCDCQRRSREGSGMVAGFVIGGIAGLAVSTAVPFAVAGAAGLAFAPEYAAAWAYSSLLLGGKVEVAGLGAAVGTQERSTTCMCWPMECGYNEESEQCEITPSATATASSNPFSTIPFTGLKCTEHTSHHWLHSGKECALTECDSIDASHVGPQIDGQQWFGRVGRSSDWEETGLYNCASSQGTVDTLMTRLQELPQGENTVENRMQILQHFSN